MHKTLYALEQDLRDWAKAWNNNPKPFAWSKTADEIVERLASYLNEFPAQDADLAVGPPAPRRSSGRCAAPGLPW